MKFATSLMVALWGWNACSAAGPAERLLIEAGKPFSLHVGESAATRDGRLRLGFDGVSADSRCPKGAQCVWAGDATVQIWLQRSAGETERRQLHTSNQLAPVAGAIEEEVILLRLDPPPLSGTDMAKRAYVATLKVNPQRTVEPER